MKHIVISTYSYRLQIEEYINKSLEKLRTKEYKPSINIEEKGKTTFVTCSFSEEIPTSKAQNYVKEYIIIPVAKAMVDIIQKEFAIEYANEIIQTSSGYNEIIITGIMEDKRQTKKLLDPIIDEITENNAFCLDGWIRFRLSKYKLYVIDMVEKLTCEYEAYREYEEFIALIRAYILNQQPLVDQIHVIPSDNGMIELYNEKREYMALDMDQYDCQDDLILGTLLTLSPLRMTIHQGERYTNTRLIDTIKSIYEDRITFCRSCEHCEKSGSKIGIMRALKDFLTQKRL